MIGVISFAQHRKDIHTDWKFKMENSHEVFQANVPGTVHQDLMRVGVIEDIYVENNEKKYQWIEEKNWEYSTTFFIDSTEYRYAVHHLVFEGLDTYAKVYLNDSLILSADNMFRRWEIDVHDIAKYGENELEVKFQSPIERNKTAFTNSSYRLPAGCEEVDVKVSPYTRKAAYHFGWDWGPRVVTAGIWKDVYLDMGWGAAISDINVVTEKISNDSAWIRYDVELALSDLASVQTLGLELKGMNKVLDLAMNENMVSIRKVVPKAKLWWPNGHGEPYLYTDTMVLKVAHNKINQKVFRYGIRKIELVTEPDSIGTSFYFKVNGTPIFVKGANYIPQDMLLPRVTDEQYDILLNKAKEANMNMLRVWGGGIYEKDIFYELCDEKGLMVWQDFMFAGSMYPSDTTFRNSVRQEVRDNIKRIRKHPSLAIWCGNNEMEVAWNNWGWQKQYGYSREDSTEIWQTYLKIFEELIPNELNSLDPYRPYTSTSPISNWGTAENFNHSTMHYWGVWHGREPFENFATNVGRFMVEYGFQSFPEMATLKKVVNDSSLSLNSVTMKNRQKSYIGNGLIEKHVKQYYHEPKSFEEFVMLSQKTQALGMKMAITEHRKAMQHCMGTMFWQLNDCWPGPSWSVIDYYGNNKLAYEAVKESYNHTLTLRDSNIITVLSDYTYPIKGGLHVKVKKKNGKVKSFFYTANMEAMSEVKVDLFTQKKVKKLLKKGSLKEYNFYRIVYKMSSPYLEDGENIWDY